MRIVMTIKTWAQVFPGTDYHRLFLVLQGLHAALIPVSVIGDFQVEEDDLGFGPLQK
jgi:hypothetical protein